MLLCIAGSLRAGSANRLLLREAAARYGGQCETGDLRFPLYDADTQEQAGIPAEVAHLADQIARAEAVVISTPEYNQMLSGVLKNALDWVSRVEGKPWLGKPVAIMAAAAGRSGGARACSSLRLALAPFRPRLSSGPEVLLANARKLTERGTVDSPQTLDLLSEAMEVLRHEARRG